MSDSAQHPKLRVAQVITRMDRGGSPDIVRLLCDGLDKKKFEVTFISGPTHDPAEKTKEFLSRFKRCIEVPGLIRDINPLKDIAAFFRLYALIKKEKFDIYVQEIKRKSLIQKMKS